MAIGVALGIKKFRKKSLRTLVTIENCALATLLVVQNKLNRYAGVVGPVRVRRIRAVAYEITFTHWRVSNHFAMTPRSASVICVTLFSGMALSLTTC